MSGGNEMKKLILVGLSLALMLMAVGCGGGDAPETTVPSGNDETVVSEPVPVTQMPNPTQTTQQDDVLPEHITMDSIADTVAVSMWDSVSVDGEDMDLAYGEIRFPVGLCVEETYQIHSEGNSDHNERNLPAKDYFQNSDGKYMFASAQGTLPGTDPATTHKLSVQACNMSEPFTLDAMALDYEGWTAKEVTVDGVSAFVLLPDVEKYDSGSASVKVCINVGTYETPYNVRYCGLEVSYNGGVTDYAQVDFDEMTNAVLELIHVDFQQAAQ